MIFIASIVLTWFDFIAKCELSGRRVCTYPCWRPFNIRIPRRLHLSNVVHSHTCIQIDKTRRKVVSTKVSCAPPYCVLRRRCDVCCAANKIYDDASCGPSILIIAWSVSSMRLSDIYYNLTLKIFILGRIKVGSSIRYACCIVRTTIRATTGAQRRHSAIWHKTSSNNYRFYAHHFAVFVIKLIEKMSA